MQTQFYVRKDTSRHRSGVHWQEGIQVNRRDSYYHGEIFNLGIITSSRFFICSLCKE